MPNSIDVSRKRFFGFFCILLRDFLVPFKGKRHSTNFKFLVNDDILEIIIYKNSLVIFFLKKERNTDSVSSYFGPP